MPTWRRHAPAVLYYCVLTVVLAYPLVETMLAGGVPGWEGDNLYYVRSLWWMQRALIDLHILPFVDVTAYYPVGHAISHSEMTVANTIPAIPITMLLGPERAYDAVLLFSFVATGFGTYLWVCHLTGRRIAGILAGTIVAFLPFRFAHLVGHLPQLTTQWIPLTLFAFERFLDRRTLSRAVWLGLGVAFVVLGCWYYGYSLALIFPIYALVRARGRDVWRDPAWWRGIAASAAVALVVVFPFLYQMLKLSGNEGMSRSIVDLQFWSLNVYDMFLPNLIHPWWGDAVAEWFPAQYALWVEKVHGLGFVAVALGVTGFVVRRGQRPNILWALLAVWVASYAIALGPFLKAGDHEVRVPMPASITHAIVGLLPPTDANLAMRASLLSDGLPVPLPSYALFKFVPFTSGMRVMARFSFWTALATAGLAAFGFITLLSHMERRWGAVAGRATVVLVLSLVCLESFSRQPTMPPLGPRAVDAWLVQQPDDVVIVEMPVEQATRAFQNYYATRNGRKNLFGWSGDSFAPPVLAERTGALKNFPDAPAMAYLRASAATYVLMTPSQIPDWDTMDRRLSAEPALQFVDTFNDVRVYLIVRQP